MSSAPITSFRDTALSNFWPARVALDNVVYPTVEHAYQAAKTLDARERDRIGAESTPAGAKALGRSVTLRPDWHRIKLDVMRYLIDQKFELRSPYGTLKLLRTGTAPLIEVNTWGDRFWGECPQGVGANQLGRLLMERRDVLRGMHYYNFAYDAGLKHSYQYVKTVVDGTDHDDEVQTAARTLGSLHAYWSGACSVGEVVDNINALWGAKYHISHAVLSLSIGAIDAPDEKSVRVVEEMVRDSTCEAIKRGGLYV